VNVIPRSIERLTPMPGLAAPICLFVGHDSGQRLDPFSNLEAGLRGLKLIAASIYLVSRQYVRECDVRMFRPK